MISQSNSDEIRPFGGEFDLLPPTDGIKVRRARLNELAGLTRVARQTIPGARVNGARLQALQRREPDSVFSFLRGTELVGGVAFLHLNGHGFDALILDELDAHDPDPGFIAAPGEMPEAIYLWAISGAGRSALGHVRIRLSAQRYKSADIYTRPVTAAGERLFASLGFEPTPSWKPGMWAYQRIANRRFAFDNADFRSAA